MSAHTPGPWKYIGETHADGWAVSLGGEPPRHRLIRCEGFSRAQADANARLVAAAPDLLAVLEALLPHVELVDLAEQARAAVKKARGES